MKKITRRKFLYNISSTAAAVSFGPYINLISIKQVKKYPATERSFAYLEVKGSYYDIGFEIGKNFKNIFHEILNVRREWFNTLKKKANSDNKKYLISLMAEGKKHFPHLIDEIKGMADGSELAFEDVFLINVKSEIFSKPDDAGNCSTIYLVNKKNKKILQNEDGSSAFTDKMFMVKAYPPSGVSFTALVYPLHLIGNAPAINSHGIGQATNFIGCRNPRTGLPRYFLNRAVLEAKNINGAVDILTGYKRAYSYHHNICSFKEKRILSVEVTPEKHEIFEPDRIYFHTNHLILDKTVEEREKEAARNLKSSTFSRYHVISNELKKLPDSEKLAEKDMMNILSNHDNAPLCVCVHPEGSFSGATLATSVHDIEKGSMKIYKENPCKAYKNGWVTEYKY